MIEVSMEDIKIGWSISVSREVETHLSNPRRSANKDSDWPI